MNWNTSPGQILWKGSASPICIVGLENEAEENERTQVLAQTVTEKQKEQQEQQKKQDPQAINYSTPLANPSLGPSCLSSY